MSLANLSRSKQRLLITTASCLLALLVLSTNVFGSAYQYYTLAQTNFSFDTAASIYYEYGSLNNTVTIDQQGRNTLNAMAANTNPYNFMHNVAEQLRDVANFDGSVLMYYYRLNSQLPGSSSIDLIHVDQNMDLSYYLSQFRDLLGDNTISSITFSFRFSCFYIGVDDSLQTYPDYSKLNMLGYNLVPTSYDTYMVRRSQIDPNLPSPNGFGLDAYYSVNILVDSLSDIFGTLIPMYYEISGLSPGYPSQVYLTTGFCFSDISLSICFDRSVQELIDVNQNLIDLRGDISDVADKIDDTNEKLDELNDKIDAVNNPNDSFFPQDASIDDLFGSVDSIVAAENAAFTPQLKQYISGYSPDFNITAFSNGLSIASGVFQNFINSGAGYLIMFSAIFGLSLWIIGSLKRY